MTAPLVGPPEAQPQAERRPSASQATERLAPPFRLGLAGLGIALGLFSRLAAANEFAGMAGRPSVVAAAIASAIGGVGLLMIAAERDRFGPSVGAISAVTAIAWGALNWISPPFASSVTVWSRPDQVVLAILGLGNGLLLAGVVALAGVRRRPTLTVAATLVAGALVLAAHSVAVHSEWPAIVCLGLAFALVLLAWDRSPRREKTFEHPDNAPRISRAALSFVSVAFCGTAIQAWISRTSLPRAMPAVILCIVLLIAAFASLVRVRREIMQRETTLSEWRSWMREIRTNDFRSELENYESTTSEPPRQLSFPDLLVTEEAVEERLDDLARFDLELDAIGGTATDSSDPASHEPEAASPAAGTLVPDAAPERERARALGLVPDPAPDGDFEFEGVVLEDEPDPTPAPAVVSASAPPAVVERIPQPDVPHHDPVAAPEEPEAAPALSHATAAPEAPMRVQVVGLEDLAVWLTAPDAAQRERPLLAAVEVMALSEYDDLPSEDAEIATEEIGKFLVDTMPDADLVAWIDGPYFIVAFGSKPDGELMALNKAVRRALKPTAGTLALLRPSPGDSLDALVDEAVQGLLKARRLEDRAAGR